MMHDGYWGVEQEDEMPLLGKTALAFTALGVSLGVLVVGSVIVGVDYAWRWRRATR